MTTLVQEMIDVSDVDGVTSKLAILASEIRANTNQQEIYVTRQSTLLAEYAKRLELVEREYSRLEHQQAVTVAAANAELMRLNETMFAFTAQARTMRAWGIAACALAAAYLGLLAYVAVKVSA